MLPGVITPKTDTQDSEVCRRSLAQVEKRGRQLKGVSIATLDRVLNSSEQGLGLWTLGPLSGWWILI